MFDPNDKRIAQLDEKLPYIFLLGNNGDASLRRNSAT
jgi:hypothetical protein